MHYLADQFIKNKKSINPNSTLNKIWFNCKFEDSNIDLTPIKMNNSSIISLPTNSSKKAEQKFHIPNFHESPLSQMENTKQFILSSFNDQIATKKMQAFLNKTSKENIAHIVYSLTGSYRAIIKNKNGNYFCSDLFKVCEQNQRIKILCELADHISEDCCHKYGSYSIQTLIDFSASEDEYKLLLNSFNDYNKFLYASLDPIGSYTIQKIIEHIPERFRIQFDLNFISFICFISIKKYGIINAKQFISFTKIEENINQIINLIANNFMNIAVNNYGNYLIQHILEKWNNIIEIKKIKIKIMDNFLFLYKNKFSYHICNLFLKLANDEEKNKLINILKLYFITGNNSEIINEIMNIINSYEKKI